MTHLFRELRRRHDRQEPIRTAVIGAGFIGRGLVYQLAKMPGMYPSLVVNRSVEKALDAYRQAGFDPARILISDDPHQLTQAIGERRPAVSSAPEITGTISTIDVAIEATGVVELGAPRSIVLHSQ